MEFLIISIALGGLLYFFRKSLFSLLIFGGVAFFFWSIVFKPLIKPLPEIETNNLAPKLTLEEIKKIEAEKEQKIALIKKRML